MLEVGKIFSAPSPTGATTGVKEFYTVLIGPTPQWSLDPTKETPRWSPDSILAEYRHHCSMCSQLENRIGVEDTESKLQTMLDQKAKVRKILMKNLAVDVQTLERIEREAEESSYVEFFSASAMNIEAVPEPASLMPMCAEEVFADAQALLEGHTPAKKSKR